MFVKYAKEYGDLCELLGNTAEKGRAYKASETMEQTILTAGWDGEWFLRAYDAFGEKIGFAKNVRKARSSSNPRASAYWPASA
ncbi:MAG: GH36-type glycosyl hydrolase domain-containing protein [Lachnospiraceae bacterium]